MPRGGWRPNAGRKSKPVDIKAAEDAARNEAAAANNPPLKADQKSAVEIMRQLSNAFFGLAAIYQPKFDASRNLVSGDIKKFQTFGEAAGSIAGRLAPFEGPTYASIRMTQSPVDLSKLSAEELLEYERLSLKATAEPSGDTRRDRPTVN